MRDYHPKRMQDQLLLIPTIHRLSLPGSPRVVSSVQKTAGRAGRIAPRDSTPKPDITSIVIDPAHPEVMYLADSFSGVFKWVNNGKTWQLFSEGLLMKSVFELAISENGGPCYAGTDGGGVYRRDLAGYPPETVSSILFFEQTPPSNQEESEDPPPQGEEILLMNRVWKKRNTGR